MTRPYSLFKKSNGYFYVQFLLPDGSRSQNKSTGTKNRLEAEKKAMEFSNVFDKSRTIIVTEAYIIVDGHSRFMAAKKIGLEKVLIRILLSWVFCLYYRNWKKVERKVRFLRIRELQSWNLGN